MKKLAVTAIILFVITLAISALYFMDLENPKNLNEKEDFKLESKSFMAEYTSDIKTSNKKYLDKIVIVIGRVKSISPVSNGVNVEIEAGKYEESISCNIDSSTLTTDLNIYKDSIISIKGRCGGYIEEDLIGIKNISLIQCSIL